MVIHSISNIHNAIQTITSAPPSLSKPRHSAYFSSWWNMESVSTWQAMKMNNDEAKTTKFCVDRTQKITLREKIGWMDMPRQTRLAA